jgi:predicted dehydrogenase
MTLRAAVIGCGSIGARYARWLAEEPDVEAGAFDLAPARTAPLTACARVFPTLAGLLEWRPQVAVIATPPHTHLAMAEAALDAGAFVLCEKPLDADVAAAQAFVAGLGPRAARFRVVCNMRFHPSVQALAQALPQVGTVRFTRAHFGHALWQMRPNVPYGEVFAASRDQGGGVILDCIHEIDYHQWLFGPVSAVRGTAAQLALTDSSVEDFAVVELAFPSGLRSVLTLDFLQRLKRRGCEIVGAEGTLVWSSEGRSPEIAEVRLLTVDGAKTIHRDEAVDPVAPYKTMLRRALAAAAGSTADDGLQTAQQALSALRAAIAASADFSVPSDRRRSGVG